MRVEAQKFAAIGLTDEAERWLRSAVALMPVSISAHMDPTSLLCRLGRSDEALALLEGVLRRSPESIWALSLKGAVLETERRTDAALTVHQALLARAPTAAVPWLNYGHALAATGALDEAIAAYRRSLALDPANGYAWWGLANLRTVRLSAEDAARMEHALPRAGDNLHCIQLHFALGKALGDIGAFEASFSHYEQANRIRSRLVPYDAEGANVLVTRTRETFTSDFLAQHAQSGCEAPDPIFIIGMPRSGSTLVEQILSSHPLVEGTGELRELAETASRIGGDGNAGPGWIDFLRTVDPDALGAIGENYLAGARRYRRTARSFFTDKMPANWQYLGLSA